MSTTGTSLQNHLRITVTIHCDVCGAVGVAKEPWKIVAREEFFALGWKGGQIALCPDCAQRYRK
jgi:hypothetical protein